MDKDMEEVDVMGMDILELSSWKLAIEIMTWYRKVFSIILSSKF